MQVTFTPKGPEALSRFSVMLGRFYIGDVIIFDRGDVRLTYRTMYDGKPAPFQRDWPSLDALKAELEA